MTPKCRFVTVVVELPRPASLATAKHGHSCIRRSTGRAGGRGRMSEVIQKSPPRNRLLSHGQGGDSYHDPQDDITNDDTNPG